MLTNKNCPECEKPLIHTECMEYEVGAGSHSFDTTDGYMVCSCGYFYCIGNTWSDNEKFGLKHAVWESLKFLKHLNNCHIFEANEECTCGLNKQAALLERLI